MVASPKPERCVPANNPDTPVLRDVVVHKNGVIVKLHIRANLITQHGIQIAICCKITINNQKLRTPAKSNGSPHHNGTTTKAAHWIDVAWSEAFADTSVYALAAICEVQFESRFVTEYHTAPVPIPANTSSVIIGPVSSKAPSPIVYDHSNVRSTCA